MNNQKTKIILLGALIGALAGTGAAYLLAQRMEEGEDLAITPKDGVKLGMSVFAFFKQVADLGKSA